jgi:hypothetical protein
MFCGSGSDFNFDANLDPDPGPTFYFDANLDLDPDFDFHGDPELDPLFILSEADTDLASQVLRIRNTGCG